MDVVLGLVRQEWDSGKIVPFDCEGEWLDGSEVSSKLVDGISWSLVVVVA